MKISVVIPIYNSQEYLEQCIKSIVNQTFNDIEIICVNDGSDDNSIVILEKFKEKIKIINQKNLGAANARNNGLKNASGEYIFFFDSDDYLKSDALEKMYNKIKTDNSDIVILSDIKINNKNLFQSTKGWAWDKLYKRDFILKNNLEFQNLRHTNDAYFVFVSLMKAKKISYLNENLIHHRVHKNSLSNTKDEKPECFYYALKKIYENTEEIYKQSFINFCLELGLWHIKTIKNKKETIKHFIKLLNLIEFKKYKISYFYNKKDYIFSKILYIFSFVF